MRERRNNKSSHQPAVVATLGVATAAAQNATVQKFDTLDDLMTSCAPYLTGSPAEYAAWLRDGLDVHTVADLGAAVEEGPELLVAGNGSTGVWQRRRFCDAVVLAAASSRGRSDEDDGHDAEPGRGVDDGDGRTRLPNAVERQPLQSFREMLRARRGNDDERKATAAFEAAANNAWSETVPSRGPSNGDVANEVQLGQGRDDNGKTSQPSAPDAKSKSFRELLRERRNANNGSPKSIAVLEPIGADWAEKIKTLDDLILTCAPYLTGSPAEYAAWLRLELGVITIADLAKAVEESPDLLVAGNGSVGMWQKRKFCDAVIAVAESSLSGHIEQR